MPSASATTTTRSRKTNGGLEGLERRLQEARRSGGRKVAVGLPRGSNPYPDGTSVIMVGAVHEFGTEDGVIPERSWMRSGLRRHRRKHREMIRKLGAAVLNGDRSYVEALELLGTQAVSDLVRQINDIKDPPNAPSTIARKKSSNPLVNTKHLAQSVTYHVFKGNE